KLTADLAGRLFKEKNALLMAAFFALHPFLFWASLEIRVYSFVILLSVLLLKFFYEGYFGSDNERQKSARIWYVALAVAALYTNYYLGFLLVGNFFALLIVRKWRAASSYFIQMMLVGAAFAPLLWAMKSQFAANTGGFQTANSIGGGLRVVWNFFLTFTLPTELLPAENSTFVSVFRLWLVRSAILTAIVSFVVKRRKLNEKTLAFGTIAAVIAAFLFAAYFLLGSDYVEIRHAAVFFAPVILFVGLAMENLFSPANVENQPEKNNRLTVVKILAAILTTAFFIYSICSLYPNTAKRGDWARVAAYIEKREQPHQPLIVFTAFDALAVSYHYHGTNRILPDERFFDWNLEAESGTADSWRRQTEFIISEIPPDAPEIWLLTNEKCRADSACEPLENFVRAHYTVIEERDFYKEKARLLRKKQND
ncbi:MAG: hypothetical protein M3T96_06545, partial [Acidobacteriota bacterium]|nr:hypothetical protein [Acidobacteriota bacterium]